MVRPQCYALQVYVSSAMRPVLCDEGHARVYPMFERLFG